MVRTRVERSASLADRVYDKLCQSMVSGDLEPGERLIFERLAGDFGVSLTPVRDAAIRLARDGLASRTASGRLRVVPMTRQYITNVYAVRIRLEGLATALATPRMSDELLAELRGGFDQVNGTGQSSDQHELRAVAKLLHTGIHQAVDNPILIHELASLQVHADYILGYVFRRFGMVYRVSLTEHVAIVDALIARDPELAGKRMEEHMSQVLDRILELIPE